MDDMDSRCSDAGEVAGLGVVGAFGFGRGQLLSALQGSPPLGLEMEIAGEAGRGPVKALLADTGPLETYLPKRSLRRLDHFSRLALLAACQALDSGGLLEQGRTGPRAGCGPGELGLVLATGYGAGSTTFAFLDSVLDDGDALASPTLFSHSVHNIAAANIAMLLEITGPCLTVSRFELSFASALCTALTWLREARVAAVLLGAVDEVCHVLAYCHARLFGRKARQAVAPGAGSAFFLLRPPRAGAGKGICLGPPIFGCGEPWNQDGLALHKGQAWILGNDGHAGCAPWYAEAAEAWPDCAVYAPIFGSTPAGHALDVAAGVLALEQGLLFPGQRRPQARAVPLEQRAVWCLKAGQTHGGAPRPWAAVPVSRRRSP